MDAMKIIRIVGCMLIASLFANAEIPDLRELFVDDSSSTRLYPYLEALYGLPSGEKLINRLHKLKKCGLKLIVKSPEEIEKEKIQNRAAGVAKTPVEKKISFEASLWLGEIGDDRRLTMCLPNCAEGKNEAPAISTELQITIPILYQKRNGFEVQNVQVPACIAVGHELIHFLHKAEVFQKQEVKDIHAINNWQDHRANLRAIATLYSFNPEDCSDENSDDDVDLDKGLIEFENDNYSNFLDSWGNNKAYEELRTITGIECNTLTKETSKVFTFKTSELEISERHLLCDNRLI